MKAKDYYLQYREQLEAGPDAAANACVELLNAMTTEAEDVLHTRNVSTPAGMAAVVDEFDRKYTAIETMFRRSRPDMPCPLLTHDFSRHWCRTHEGASDAVIERGNHVKFRHD